MTIKNMVGIMGWPIEHSLSPTMHNQAFKALSLDDWMYVRLPVNKYPYIRVKEAILGLRALSFKGANVTVPYKEAVLPYMEKLSEQAKLIQAINTISIDEGERLVGHNTDADGFAADLADKGMSISEIDALILGAGGAARAICVALLERGIKHLTIVNRTVQKADDLASYLKTHYIDRDIHSGPLDAEYIRHIPLRSLVVNCTSVGCFPNVNDMPWDENLAFSPSQIVYDTIYNPFETKLLAHAKKSGAKAFNGLGMLVHQGALSFKLWTGLDAPVEVMKQACVSLGKK